MEKKFIQRKGLALKKALWYPQLLILVPVVLLVSAIGGACSFIYNSITKYDRWWFYGGQKHDKR
jgi:hypothetical protein